MRRLDQLNVSVGFKSKEDNILLKKLPLNNIEELKDFNEALLENETNEKAFVIFFVELFFEQKKCKFYLKVNYIRGIGGRNPKRFIQRSLSEIFTNELALKCSWCGFRGNHKIQTYKCVTIIKGI